MSPAAVDGHPEDVWIDSGAEYLQEIIDGLSREAECNYECQPMTVSLLDIARPAKVKGTSPPRNPCKLTTNTL